MENKINDLILKITTDPNAIQLTWKELGERFGKLNEGDNYKANKIEYALIMFDFTQMPNPDYRLPNQTYWVISSNAKVFQSWAIGYSLFAYCIGDKTYERMERVFNSKSVASAFIITQEQHDNLHK